MLNIFDYQDYRKFLADYYQNKKTTSPGFSYQNFSRKAGYTSKSFLFNVIQGKKTLSRASVVRLCGAMSLSKNESAYFENLVYFNQAINVTERTFYFEKLNAIRPATPEATKARDLRQDQYEFYSQWYHAVIRSLIDVFPDMSDPKMLAKMVVPTVTPKQAQKSIDLLLRLGLITARPSGGYDISTKILSTGSDLQSMAVAQFHLSCMELAAQALKDLPRENRNISGLTLGISKKAYDDICRELLLFQNKILSIAETDNAPDGVYQLNFQFFPVSKTTVKKQRSGNRK